MQVLTIRGLELEFLEEGELFPWLGPALRGCVGGVLKDEVCRQPPAERWRIWNRCAGCGYTAQCPYALLFDPDRPAKAQAKRGEESVTPPLVMAPDMLADASPGRKGGPIRLPRGSSRRIDGTQHFIASSGVRISAGSRLPVTAVLVGPVVDLADLLLEILDRAVRTHGLGKASDRVRASCGNLANAPREYVHLRADDLPSPATDDTTVVPRVTIELKGPLKIKQHGKPCKRPQFANFIAYSARQVDRLFRTYDPPFEYNAKQLDALACQVPRVTENFRPFKQDIQSERGEKHHDFRGVIGSATFADVPMVLLPWLVWGGRLHVGDRRAYGAGGWRVVLD